MRFETRRERWRLRWSPKSKFTIMVSWGLVGTAYASCRYLVSNVSGVLLLLVSPPCYIWRIHGNDAAYLTILVNGHRRDSQRLPSSIASCYIRQYLRLRLRDVYPCLYHHRGSWFTRRTEGLSIAWVWSSASYLYCLAVRVYCRWFLRCTFLVLLVVQTEDLPNN